MEKEQFDEIREFAKSLTQKRQQVSDAQLLDQCQQHLNSLVEHMALEFEDAPHENAAEPEPELPLSAPPLPPEPEPEHREVHQHSSHQPPHHKKAVTKKHR